MSAKLPGWRGAFVILGGTDKRKRAGETMAQHSRQRGDGF